MIGAFLFFVGGGSAVGVVMDSGVRFGQWEGKLSSLSPKLGQVQTEKGKKAGAESEVGPGSDREREKGRC
jgi:hypothetical protein